MIKTNDSIKNIKMKFIDVGENPVRFIAIGGNATGVLAIGAFAVGGIAIGWMSYGVFAVGQLSCGVVTVGQLTAGLVSAGQVALAVIYGVVQGGIMGFGVGQGYFAVLSSFKIDYKYQKGRLNFHITPPEESLFLTVTRIFAWFIMWTAWWMIMNITGGMIFA